MANSETDESTGSDKPCGCDEPVSPERRRFLTWLSVALGGIGAALAGIPVIGFLFSPVGQDDDHVWRPVGPVENFPADEMVLVRYMDPDPLPWGGYVARNGAYIRREPDGTFVAFSIYCTHTACPITWSEGAQLFMCPCHGGTFHRNGQVAGGPPPRPLEQFDVRVHNGQVEIRTMGLPLTG